MSNEEKARMVANALADYQRAKSNLAFVTMKLRNVATAYQTAAHALSWGEGQNAVRAERGGLIFGTKGAVAEDDLLGYGQLHSLIVERDSLRENLAVARAQLAELGFSCVN